MSHLQRLVITGGLLAMTGTAHAIKDPETGVSFPDTARCAGASAKAAGVGVREATLGIDVYAVVVYVAKDIAKKSVRWSHGCVLIRARFVRDVGADKIRDAWKKGLMKNGVSSGDPALKKFLSVIRGEMKEKREMVMEIKRGSVAFKYMGHKVSIAKASKLGRAIKKLYLGSGSPTPALVKSVRKRGVAKP